MILTFEHKGLYAQPFNDLLKKLLVKDENINSSRFVLKKANNELSAAFSSYTPKLDITVPLGREKLINNGAANTNLDYYELNAKITQNIYDFGLTSSKYQKAQNQLELAKVSKNNIKSNKILEAINAYLNYVKAYKVLTFSRKSEKRIIEVTNLENEKVAKGAGLASNVLQSKARLAGAKSLRVRFEGDLAIASNRFFNVFRELPSKNFNTFEVPQLPLLLLPKSEEEAIKIAKKNNIALKLSEINLKNTKNDIRSSKAKFFPSIKAIAEYKNKRNSSGLEGTEVDQIYKIEMKYPISIGGPFGFFYKENSEYKAALNQYMIAKYSYDKMARNLEESIRNAWQTKIVAKQNFEFLTNQANISGEFFELAKKEVKLGNRQLIDILSSETGFINAKSSAEGAFNDYQISIYQLLLAIGILDEKVFYDKKNKDSNNINKSEINLNIKTNSKENVKPINIIPDETINLLDKKLFSKDNKEEKLPILIQKQKALSLEKNLNRINESNKVMAVTKKNKSDKRETFLFDTKKLENEKKEVDNVKNNKSIGINNVEETDLKINKDFLIKNFKIQLGAFKELENAEILLDLVIKRIEDPIKLEILNLQNLYKVKSYLTFSRKKAQKVCQQFTDNFFSCIISKI